MPAWREVLSFAKEAKEIIQNSSMLNPLARGAIKLIPVAGEILLEIWDNSADTAEDKSEQIMKTLNTIERMNESTFQTFCQKIEDNRIEILRNRDMLNQILFDTTLILDKMSDLDEKVVGVDEKVVGIDEKINLILNSLHIEKKISVENIVTKQYEEKIEKLHREKESLVLELEKSNKKPSIDITLTLREANFFYYAKKMEQAIKLYDIILKENPNEVNVLSNKGLALSRLDKNEEAIVWYDKALAINEKDIDAINNKGLALSRLDKNEEAIVWYDKALAINEKDIDAINNKGLALSRLDKNEEAIVWYDKALAIDSNYIKSLNNKGLALSRLDKNEEAIVWYDKALAIDGNNISTLNNMGLELYRAGKYQEAIGWYDKALAIDGNDPNALYNKSCSCALTGDISETILLLQKAISLDNSYKNMAKNDKDFSILNKDKQFQKLVHDSQ